MKISIVNGSPKLGKSTSGLMIEYLTPYINDNEITVYNICKMNLTQEQVAQIQKSDVLIFAFSLYIDCIPSHLLRFLVELQERGFSGNTVVYCITNNGFYEGKQNHIAFDIIRNWCSAAGVKWGQGIGLGAGEMLPFLKDIPLEHGPNKNIGKAFKQLAANIRERKSGDNLFASPNFPRPLWKMCASRFVWNPRMRQNGLKKKDMYKQII